EGAESETQRCLLCGWPLKASGIKLQEGLSGLFRRALRKDPKFVARVKADVPWLADDVVCERFSGPLAWLAHVWRRRTKPPGRPHDPARSLAIVCALDMLMQTHAPERAQPGEPLFDP